MFFLAIKPWQGRSAQIHDPVISLNICSLLGSATFRPVHIAGFIEPARFQRADKIVPMGLPED